MKKFEYKKDFERPNIEYLNRMGNDGWELVCIMDGDGTSATKRIFWKRALPESNEKTEGQYTKPLQHPENYAKNNPPKITP